MQKASKGAGLLRWLWVLTPAVLGMSLILFHGTAQSNSAFLLFKLFLFSLNALFVMLGFFGLWASRRIWKRFYFIIIAPIIYFALIDTLYVATPRHQVPIIPFMMIFASVGLISILNPRRLKE